MTVETATLFIAQNGSLEIRYPTSSNAIGSMDVMLAVGSDQQMKQLMELESKITKAQSLTRGFSIRKKLGPASSKPHFSFASRSTPQPNQQLNQQYDHLTAEKLLHNIEVLETDHNPSFQSPKSPQSPQIPQSPGHHVQQHLDSPQSSIIDLFSQPPLRHRHQSPPPQYHIQVCVEEVVLPPAKFQKQLPTSPSRYNQLKSRDGLMDTAPAFHEEDQYVFVCLCVCIAPFNCQFHL